MHGSDLVELRHFLAVSRRGSFTRAAADLGVSPSTLSQAIRNLEARLEIALLNRTTRSVRPTNAGQKLLDQLETAFAEIDAAVDQLNDYRESPAGTLRLCVTNLSERLVIRPLQAEFSALYPDIILDVCVDDRMDDIVAGHFDAGIRLSGAVSQDMIAVHVTPPSRFVLVGSPTYFSTHGYPDRPEDLLAHNCLRYRISGQGRIFEWLFERDGKLQIVPIKGNIISGDLELLRDAAVNGTGIAGLYEREVADLIEQGLLEAVLDGWTSPLPGLDIFFPYQRQTHTALRKFVDLAKRRSHRLKSDLRPKPNRPFAAALMTAK